MMTRKLVATRFSTFDETDHVLATGEPKILLQDASRARYGIADPRQRHRGSDYAARFEAGIDAAQSQKAATVVASGVSQAQGGRGPTYLLHNADSGWKIAVLIGHDTEAAWRE
jgi:hypothetical protein